MTKLYEIANEFKGLQALVEAGDLSEEDIADTIEGVEAEFKDKVKACLCVRQEALRGYESLQAEADRLSSLAAAKKQISDNLTAYVKHNMLAMGLDKVDADLFKVSIRKATKQLGDIDESKVPLRYFDVVPESKKLNKRALLGDAKASPIEGVELIDSERSITIK